MAVRLQMRRVAAACGLFALLLWLGVPIAHRLAEAGHDHDESRCTTCQLSLHTAAPAGGDVLTPERLALASTGRIAPPARPALLPLDLRAHPPQGPPSA